MSYAAVEIKIIQWAEARKIIPNSTPDVQAIWRKFGWTPPSEKMLPPPPEKYQEPLRRVR